MSKSNQTAPIKPYVLRKEEAENDIFIAVSKSAKIVPFCTLEDILTNLLHQVREKAVAERENAASIYEQQIAEYEKAEAKNIEEAKGGT